MPSLRQLFRHARMARADLRAACHALQKSEGFRHACAFTLTGAFLALVPELAHAGIWNGGLCQGYQQIMDSEMAETVSLAAAAGGVVAWLMDDGKSQVKTMALRVGAGTLFIINLPVIWAAIFNHGTVACAAS
jgi:hypothetical protein